MSAPDWIWYGRDSDGKSQVSFGRWRAHKCQLRYKLAAIQPTEHDYTRAPLAEALAVMADATLYGAGIMQDGKRIDPQDFFALPDPAAPTGHWKDACRESNGPEICDEPCSKCLRAIGGDA